MGDRETTVATALAQVLAGHTETPESCFFAGWEGYGYPAAHEDSLVTFPPDRR
ncbi:hypothetical protein ART_3175 [Arthrobacter sp. PAMC 25486]|nr:hypothetical protein ART_3175 [Arthrobacter sp. PAMC 25486]